MERSDVQDVGTPPRNRKEAGKCILTLVDLVGSENCGGQPIHNVAANCTGRECHCWPVFKCICPVSWCRKRQQSPWNCRNSAFGKPSQLAAEQSLHYLSKSGACQLDESFVVQSQRRSVHQKHFKGQAKKKIQQEQKQSTHKNFTGSKPKTRRCPVIDSVWELRQAPLQERVGCNRQEHMSTNTTESDTQHLPTSPFPTCASRQSSVRA